MTVRTGPTSQAVSPPAAAVPDVSPDAIGHAIAEVARVIVGQHHMVDQLMVSLLAKGHCLLEGVPGTAKTLAVSTFATVVGGTFARLQFTPDLVPSDIVGTRIYRPSEEGFSTEWGPVFVNFVLADEINRAPAKVQSAMLELMAERQVSIAGHTRPLPKPFIVFATQNPIESEGVYPLPEAQRDRFLMKVEVPLPDAADEHTILARMAVDPPTARPVLRPAEIIALQHLSDRVFVHDLVADYIVRLVMATRQPTEYGLAELEGVITNGSSPRATLGLMAGSRALALIRGRDYVLPQDVQEIAHNVLPHRLVLTFDAVAEGIETPAVINRLIEVVPPPRPVWRQRAGRPASSGTAGHPGQAGQGSAARPEFT